MLKFLLNMNIPRSLAAMLTQAGRTARHVGDISLQSAKDAPVIEEARRHNEVIVKNDLDYSRHLIFEGAAKPSLVVLWPRQSTPSALFRLLMANLSQIEGALAGGAVVVIEPGGVRIRPLLQSGDK